VLDGLGGVRDSMVMHLEDDGGMGRLLLLVDAAEDLDREELTGRIRTAIRTELSPRHVPDDVVYVPAIPRNATGKRLEIPLKRLVQAALAGQQADPGTVGDPEEVGALVTAVREALA
jgi:acetoacetyl-CoA synthetase